MPFPNSTSPHTKNDGAEDSGNGDMFPHAKKFNTKLMFSAEPDQADQDEEEKGDSRAREIKSRWQNGNRPALELHCEQKKDQIRKLKATT